MKLWNRVCSLLLAMALLFGLLPTVRPTVVEAAAPAGVYNHLPSTAKDIVYLSDMAWEYSINYGSGQTIRDTRWSDGNPIVLGATNEANGGTKFTKGLGVMPNNNANFISNTVFDLSDNNYAQSFFYSAVGITNANGITYAAGDTMSNGSSFAGEGVIFEVWASYDRAVTDYTQANWTLLESSGKVTKGYVYQFHLDVTGVRYLKLVTNRVGNISSMNSAWGGACVYNNPGWYPKADLLHDTNASNQDWLEPDVLTAFNTYHYLDSLPEGAVSLSASPYKDADCSPSLKSEGGKVVESIPTSLGNGTNRWVGGASINTSGAIDQTVNDGIQFTDNGTKFLRFNVQDPKTSNYVSDSWITYDISDLDVNRFYALVGFSNDAAKQNAYNPGNGAYGGMKVQVWGAETETGTYTLISESEVILLSNTGEFMVDITGVNFLKLRIQLKDTRSRNAADIMFCNPCVYKTENVIVDGDNSVLRGTTGAYTATVTGGEGTVSWAVSGNSSASTTISSDGVLTVGSDETSSYVDVTASATVSGETVTATFPVVVLRTPRDMYNQLPTTATDVKYLSDMSYKFSSNRDNMATKKDVAVNGTPIVMGDLEANGGTRFTKGLSVKPDATANSSHTDAMQTVFDLSDNNYAQSYFYAAAGIINDVAKQTGSTVTRGVYFAVYGSYDKTVNSYENAEYVLLETSGKITKGAVHQFHVDVTGVRYLKLVVYAAQTNISNMDCSWAGACVYNNEGYYPKTDMIGDCNQNSGAYIPYEDRDPSLTPNMFNAVENMFNTYQFEKLPADATMLRSRKHSIAYTPGIGNVEIWIGGGTVSVNGQGPVSRFDGIKLPANSSPYFKTQLGDSEGYVVYDVSGLNANTFYAIVGAGGVNSSDYVPQYTDYDRATGLNSGVGFEIWGTYEDGGEFKLLAASEIINKSNTGEFIVDISGVKLLKLRHFNRDPRSKQIHGVFAYASVFNSLSVSVSGGTSVEKGASETYTAVADNGLATTDVAVTWSVTGAKKAGTTIDKNGVLTVAADETATELTVTASATSGDKTVTDSVTVTVVAPAEGVLNHRPATATDIKHLSNMTWEYSINNGGGAAVRDRHRTNNNPIVLGDLAENGGVSTTFSKGLGVQPDDSMDSSHEGAMQTVFDLADNDYKQSMFYAAAGITNDAAKQTGSTIDNGVYFAVWASYDKTEENYADAEYVLLETSDKITNGKVHQFHLDITGVRYLKLVVYAAQNSFGYMDCSWAGACVYNNPGYTPKTDMIGSCKGDEGAYVAPANPTMFNTYHFDNLPTGATYLATLELADKVVHNDSVGVGKGWLGGTHVAVNGLDYKSQKDGIKFPDNTAVHFNVPMEDETVGATDGYVVYNVSELGADTFYCIVGSVNPTYKYSDYIYNNIVDADGNVTASGGDFGGMVFEVWGANEQDGEYTLLSASEPILKSNTGEFLVDITGYNYLKLQIRAQDSRTNGYATGAFVYASVFNETWDVADSDGQPVVKGAAAEVTAKVTRGMIPADYYTYPGNITWTVDGVAGTTVVDGVLSVDPNETAETLNVIASITEGGNSYSGKHKLTVKDYLAYVNGVGYSSLPKATSAANGVVVELMADTELTGTMLVNSAETIDLNGNTVSGAENIALGAKANLTITGSGSLDGKLKLVADGATITSDCAIALEMNGFDATVNADNVTLTDSATNNGVEGGKIYGDCTVASRVSKNGAVQYVILDGEDADGTPYKTANAVRVQVSKVSIRPSAAGMYYTTQLKFNKNVADAIASANAAAEEGKKNNGYGVVLSTHSAIDEDFMTEKNGEDQLVNLWTARKPKAGENFSSTGNSCLVQNILSSDTNVTAAANALRGAMFIYANGYVKLTVDGEEIVILAENNGTVKYGLQTVMTAFNAKLKTELRNFAESKDEADLSTTGKNLYDFYETWEPVMRGWKLSNLIAAYERDIDKSHVVVVSDILNGRIIVTDLDKTNALTDPTWTWKPSSSLGWDVTVDELKTGLIAEVKYRQHPKWGDVVFFCGAGTVGAIEYPSGKCLWEIAVPNSPHGIEMLPGGDIVVSSSGGGTTANGTLYYYNWTGSAYKQTNTYSLEGSHSVTWDGSYLWVMGKLGLMKYTVDATNNRLTKVGQVWSTDSYGHDVSPDYSDSNILWLTDNAGVYRFNKTTGEATKSENPASMGSVKSVAAFPDKEVAWASYSDCGEAENPPTIRAFRPRRNGTYVTVKLTDETSGWNKVRPFIADYQ